jgi:aminoglycoside phosphotransferase (APT) family kinase protein
VSKPRTDRRLREAARAIVSDCIGSAPRRVFAESGGQTNAVFRVDGQGDSFVLRMSPDEGKLDGYRKEHWAIECARRANVPAPEVLQVGRTADGIAFMLSRRAPGWPATRYGNSHETLAHLGRLARALHETTLPAFGGDFREDEPPRSAWETFVDEEFRLDERVAQLRALQFIDDAQGRRIVELVRGLGAGRDARLNHGDLRLKNVFVDAAGKVTAVLDWEFATAAPAPEWDLAVALHDLSIDQKDAFIDGYGLDGPALLSLGPVLAALNVLHYAPYADDAARGGDDEQLQRYRRRFARLYDLYSID